MKMKHLLAGLVMLGLTACGTSKFTTGRSITKMTDAEIKAKGYRLGNYTVYERDTVAIGELQSFEFECYKGKVIQEISVVLYDPFRGSSTDVMRFMYTKFKRAKIEINYDNSKYMIKADER